MSDENQKITNFHTHTVLCGHAVGEVKEYVLQAQKDGCSALGFSEHCPYPESALCYDEGRMKISQIPFYKNQIKEAEKLVDFPVYYGFECEYQKENHNWLKDGLMGTYGVDYLVFGCHWCKNHLYIMNAQSIRDFHDWTDVTIQGISSGLFKFIAHPDLIMQAYVNWDENIKSMLGAVLDAAADSNLPIEINGNGLNRDLMKTKNGIRHPYPYDEFWEMVKSKKGIKVICNSDAHNPAHTIKWAQDAREYAKKMGIEIIDNIFKQ